MCFFLYMFGKVNDAVILPPIIFIIGDMFLWWADLDWCQSGAPPGACPAALLLSLLNNG